jgi:hypothetical protein
VKNRCARAGRNGKTGPAAVTGASENCTHTHTINYIIIIIIIIIIMIRTNEIKKPPPPIIGSMFFITQSHYNVYNTLNITITYYNIVEQKSIDRILFN